MNCDQACLSATLGHSAQRLGLLGRTLWAQIVCLPLNRKFVLFPKRSKIRKFCFGYTLEGSLYQLPTVEVRSQNDDRCGPTDPLGRAGAYVANTSFARVDPANRSKSQPNGW
jgi:hypothetical protein